MYVCYRLFGRLSLWRIVALNYLADCHLANCRLADCRQPINDLADCRLADCRTTLLLIMYNFFGRALDL